MVMTAGLLQVITSAVTPVVLISAAAALILGINQKVAALADRLRALAVEFRASTTTAARRDTIQEEVRLFARRFTFVSLALQWLYAAVACFLAMVLVVSLTPRTPIWDLAALAILVLGVGLVLGAVVGELLEARLGGRTVSLEIRDVLTPVALSTSPAGPAAAHAGSLRSDRLPDTQ